MMTRVISPCGEAGRLVIGPVMGLLTQPVDHVTRSGIPAYGLHRTVARPSPTAKFGVVDLIP
jgi:hypothetical protein